MFICSYKYSNVIIFTNFRLKQLHSTIKTYYLVKPLAKARYYGLGYLFLILKKKKARLYLPTIWYYDVTKLINIHQLNRFFSSQISYISIHE